MSDEDDLVIKYGGHPFPKPWKPALDQRPPKHVSDEPFRDISFPDFALPKFAVSMVRVQHEPSLPQIEIRILDESNNTAGSVLAGFLAAVLRRFSLTYAWPWPRLVFEVSGNESQGLVTILVPVRHARDGNATTLVRSAEFSRECHATYVERKIAALLEEMFVHEFREALLLAGTHVTNPHPLASVELRMAIKGSE